MYGGGKESLETDVKRKLRAQPMVEEPPRAKPSQNHSKLTLCPQLKMPLHIASLFFG